MIKVTYYLGTNDRDTLKPELCKSDFVKVFDELFRDYTLTEAVGRFTNTDKIRIEEQSLIVTEFHDDSMDKNYLANYVKKACRDLKYKLNQESVLVTIENVNGMFL